jgi:hypothetical protein
VIPDRRRAALPAGHWWIVDEHQGHLTVTLSAAVPCDSALEHELVQAATRAWRRHNRPGLILLPIPAVGAGVAWAARKARQPVAATGVVVGAAMVAAAAVVALSGPDTRPPQHGPLAVAPPVDPTARLPERIPKPYKPAPQQSTGPDRPGSSAPRPAPSGPRPRAGGGVLAAGDGRSSGPGKPRSGKPPVPEPPSAPPPKPPPPTAAGCRLVEVNVGHLVRICL